jgi:hypothetical protein
MKFCLRKCFLAIISLLFNSIYSQVGIGTVSPSGKSILDITSNSAGVLFPRVTTAQRIAISPAITDTGLSVYDTTTKSYWYWDGITWVEQITSVSGWKLSGNTGTSAGTNFIGTTDAIDFVTKTNNTERMRVTNTGNIGIGSNAPLNRLHIVNNADGEGVLRVDNGTAGGFSGTYFFQGGNYRGHIGYVNIGGASGFGGKGYFQIAAGQRPFIFSTNPTSEMYLERMIIAQDGRVGINTNPTNASITIQPTSTLQVYGSFATRIASINTTSTLGDDICKVILSNGASNITITLPDPSTCVGRLLSFSRNSSSTGTVTLDPMGTNNIQNLNGTVTNTTVIPIHSIAGTGVNIQFWSDGAIWYR